MLLLGLPIILLIGFISIMLFGVPQRTWAQDSGDLETSSNDQLDLLQQYKTQVAELQKRCTLLENIVESLPEATFVIDQTKQVIIWNKAIEELTGVKKDEMLGKGDYEYSLAFHPEKSKMLIDLVISDDSQDTLPDEEVTHDGHALSTHNYQKSLIHGKNTFLWAKAVPLLGPDGEKVGALETMWDVTTHSQTEQQLKYLQTYDPLTDFYNRTQFSLEMNRIASENIAPISFIVCNIDGLKLINDTIGHRAGDSILLAASQIIRDSIMPEDIVARIGGDEFAILLPHCDKDRLDTICNSIRTYIVEYNSENPELPLSVSLGAASSKQPVADLRDLFKEADNNMFHEKLHYNHENQTATIQILMKALESKDFIKEGHVDRLQSILVSVGASMDMTERRIQGLRLLAKFHDIGKVGIPDRILLKQGPLTPREVSEMQRHCEIGFRIAQNAPVLVPVADWILKHHEWWNGKGYPLGLREKEIPLECRLFAIADAYDALTSDRPYRKAMPHEKAAAELNKRSGTQFDPEIVKNFLDILDKEHGKVKVQVINGGL